MSTDNTEYKSHEDRFDHSKNSMFKALDVLSSKGFLEDAIQECVLNSKTVSESIVKIIKSIQQEELGDSHPITKYEVLLFLAGLVMDKVGSHKNGSRSGVDEKDIPDEIKGVIDLMRKLGGKVNIKAIDLSDIDSTDETKGAPKSLDDFKEFLKTLMIKELKKREDNNKDSSSEE